MDLLEKILLEGVEWRFLWEIVTRTIFMFLLILIVLRLSGRRGVRQLTLFEVAIILGLGSAAGDPMFQEDIPILYSVVVLLSVIVLYKIITWAASRSDRLTSLLEGRTMTIVEDGMFNLKGNRNADFSQNEFFAELRNRSIEHLGQVRMALLEVDGTLSLLKYDNKDVRYGLPLFPNAYIKIDTMSEDPPYACMFCGKVMEELISADHICPRCDHREWTKALNTPYI